MLTTSANDFFITFAAMMNLDLLTAAEAEALQQLINGAARVVLTGHKSPDGDALGSSLGWAFYLRQLGKQVQVVMPDAFPDFLKWLPGSEAVLRFDKQPDAVAEAFRQADLVCCLDFGEPHRVEAMHTLLEQAEAPCVVMDHHLNPNIRAAQLISFPELSSTSEIVFRVVHQLGGFEALSKAAATAIYCGMMTDTGGFTYNSTRPELYTIIGLLLTKGIDKDKIYRRVFNNYSQSAIRFRGYLMHRSLHVFEEYHAAYYLVGRKDMKDFNFVKGDLEGLVNEPLRIKGMRLSISLREDDRTEQLIWVSLRSVDDFPCNEMAAEFFNGGGHLNASGGRLQCTLAEAEQVVHRAILKYGDRLKN